MKKLLLLLFSILLSVNSYANITYTPDGFGGYRGSNGVNYTSDGFGGLRGSNGSNCTTDMFGNIRCSNQSGSYANPDTSGWGAITNSMGGIGTSIGKSFGNSNSNSGSSYNPRINQLMEEIRKAQEANSFKPPVQFSGKWKEVTSSADGTTFYIDENTLMRGGDSVFYWELTDNTKTGPQQDRSTASYNEASCDLMANKFLTLNLYRQQMGRSLIKKIEYRPDKEWNYTDPGYISHAIIEEVCILSSNDSVNLSCEGEGEAFSLTIYPSSKKLREEGDGGDLDSYKENGEEIYWNSIIYGVAKLNYSLNRVSGWLSSSYQPYSLEKNTWDPVKYEMLYQCSKEDALF